MNLGPIDLIVCGGILHISASICSLGMTSLNYCIFIGNKVVFHNGHVWESRIHHRSDFLKTIYTRRYGNFEIVFKFWGKQMVNAIHIMFVLEYFRKLTNCLFV